MTIKALVRLFQIQRTLSYYRIDELIYERFENKYLKWWIALHMGKKISPEVPRDERIHQALETLGPIFIKFGQLLSTRPDIFPPDIAIALNRLQSDVTPFASSEVLNIIEKEIGKPETIFSEFESTPLACASIAQVHRATLLTGEKVVLKVKRPDIESQILIDLKWLALFAKTIAFFIPAVSRFKPVEVIQDVHLTLLDELDFQREAANANQLGRNFENSPLLYVPKVYWDYTKGDVITMEEIIGLPVTHVEKMKEANVNFKVLAERGVEIFFTQVFRDSFFHADMHPGNIYVDIRSPSSPRYFALDCAIMGTLTESDQRYLAENLIAFFNRDYQQVAKLHVQSGWVPKGTSIAAFESAIRTVCEPIFAKPLKDISFGQTLYNLFKVAKRFDMQVQPQLILLQKTLLSIEGLGRQLYPELDLWQTAKPFLERWVKQRYKPKNIFKLLKAQFPIMIDLLPELPKVTQSWMDNINQVGPAQQSSNLTPVKIKKLTKAIVASAFILSSAIIYSFAPESPGQIIAFLALIIGLYQLKPITSP